MGQLLPALLSLQTERPEGGPLCSREGNEPALWVEISPRPPRYQAHQKLLQMQDPQVRSHI